jgi:hypothetical protein
MSVSRVITERLIFVSLLLCCVFAQACSTETMPTDPIDPQPTSGSLELTIEETGPRPALAVIDADGSGLTRLHPVNTTPLQTTGRPNWSPTQIAYVGGASSNRIWIVEFDDSAFGEAFAYRFGSAPSWR